MTLAVCDIAKSAGSYIREERRKFSLSQVERKHAHDYVSYVDKGSETRIVTALRQLLPEAGFITEEGSAGHDREQLVWVIDPLDGTTNFIHQYAPYAVSIALMQGRSVILGVVYEICARSVPTSATMPGKMAVHTSTASLYTSVSSSSKMPCSACNCPTTARPTSRRPSTSSTPSTAAPPASA